MQEVENGLLILPALPPKINKTKLARPAYEKRALLLKRLPASIRKRYRGFFGLHHPGNNYSVLLQRKLMCSLHGFKTSGKGRLFINKKTALIIREKGEG